MYIQHDVNDVQYQYFRKPPKLSRKDAFKKFLYDPNNGEIFGRTGTSWGKVEKTLTLQIFF
jgi:Sodium / potassium ATPase beta chain